MKITIEAETLTILAAAARAGAAQMETDQLPETLDAIRDAESIMREAAENDPEEPCLVRRTVDGQYLVIQAGGGGARMIFSRIEFANVWPRTAASAIATALIAIIGDHGIEIEPANG